MKKNLSGTTVKATKLTGTPMMVRMPENETALGKKHRKAVIDRYGEEKASRLLDVSTMLATMQEEIDRIYADNSIVDKESTIREELLIPIALHTTACETTKIARKCKKDNLPEETLISVGEWEVNKTVNRLTIQFDKETQKMRVHSIENEPIKFFSAYMKNFTKKIYNFVGKKSTEGLNDSENTVISLVNKGRKNGFCGKIELIGYVTKEINSQKFKKAEKKGKEIKDIEKMKKETEEEVTGIYDNYYTDSLEAPLENSDGDDYTLLDKLANKEADFINNSIDNLDGTSSSIRIMTIMEITFNTLKEESERKAKMYGTNVNDETEFGIALFYTSSKYDKDANISAEEHKESIRELRYQMSEYYPSFENIISKYGETYSDIAKAYIAFRNKSSITNTALGQQGDTLRKKVKAKVTKYLFKAM